MRRFVPVIVILLCMPACLCAQEISLTLDEALALALRDNRDVQLKAQDVLKAQARAKEAKSGLMPTLNFTGGWTDTRGLYSKDVGQTSAQFSAKQTLFKGGKVVNSISQAKYSVDAAKAGLDKSKLELALNVKKAFYTLLLTGEYAALNKSITDNTGAHLAFLQARYQSGQASESEILSIKESLAAVEEAKEASANQQEVSAAILRNLLFLKDDAALTAKGELSGEPKDLAYDEGFLKAMQSRPEIKQFEAQEKAAQKAVDITKADGRPAIYASWDYYSKSHAAGVASVSKNWNDYNILGVTFSWPLFDGWQTKHRVEQAIVDLKEAQLVKEKAYKDIALELKVSYLNFKNAIAALKSAQAQSMTYENAFKTAQERQAKGLASSLELDDAAVGRAVARFTNTQALYDYLIAKVTFEKATGGS